MRYYSILRPVAPGTFPKPATNRILSIENFDTWDGRMFCPEIGREAWGYIEYEKPLIQEDISSYDLMPQKFPRYVKTYDGYIGVLVSLDFGEFPVYRFPGGDRIADSWEIENGSNDRDILKSK